MDTLVVINKVINIKIIKIWVFHLRLDRLGTVSENFIIKLFELWAS